MATKKLLKAKTEKIFIAFSSKLSKGAKSTYLRYVNGACKYLEKDFLDITSEDAQKYCDYLFDTVLKDKKLKKWTIHTMLSSLNSFGRYIEENYKATEYKNPFENIIKPVVDNDIRLDRIPTWEELDNILKSAKEYDLTTFVIITMVAKMGLSSSSILRLKVSDLLLDDECPSIHVNGAYQRKDLTIKIPSDIYEILKEYLKEKSYLLKLKDKRVPLFYNSKGAPLSARILQYNISKIQEGFDNKYTLKEIKTRGLVAMLSSGASTKEVSDYTGLEERRLIDYQKVGSLPCPADLTHIYYRL